MTGNNWNRLLSLSASFSVLYFLWCIFSNSSAPAIRPVFFLFFQNDFVIFFVHWSAEPVVQPGRIIHPLFVHPVSPHQLVFTCRDRFPHFLFTLRPVVGMLTLWNRNSVSVCIFFLCSDFDCWGRSGTNSSEGTKQNEGKFETSNHREGRLGIFFLNGTIHFRMITNKISECYRITDSSWSIKLSS